MTDNPVTDTSTHKNLGDNLDWNLGTSRARDLACPECGNRADMDLVQTLCSCGRPWLVDYDLQGLDGSEWKQALRQRPWSLWRYSELLPVRNLEQRVDLGEGATPLLGPLPGPVLGAQLIDTADGLISVYLKQEASNPTGSFKDRGLSLAINRARELGVEGVELPSAGNAGIAAAAYSAAAGLRCRVALPQSTPERVVDRCRDFGAEVIVAGETLVDAGRVLVDDPQELLSLATLREPYRAEGKKTLGYELIEQLQWRAPDWILFPTGGGTGIVAMHKAFGELEQLGLLDQRPRLVAVQSDGCAPLVAAFDSGEVETTAWSAPSTEAWGLKVPHAIGDRLTLRALRESGGQAVAVPEAEIAPRATQATRTHGLVVGPEGAAALLALEQLVEAGYIKAGQSVVVFQTGHPANYA